MCDLGTESTSSSTRGAGAWAATGAFLLWGVMPVFWKQLQGVAAIELIAHRVVWSLALLLVLVHVRGRGPQLRATLRNPRVCGHHLLSGSLLAANWLIFIWAVNAGFIVEASLGYFLNPLCNIALGFLFLRERMRPLQWVAIVFAAAGVIVQLVQVGRLPWVALGLAVTFSIYGLLRKRGPLGPVAGLGLETLLLAPVAVAFLVWRGFRGEGALGQVDLTQHALILSTGVITTVPLLWFATAARALPLSVVGVFQYLTPSGHFLLGVLAYHEVFGRTQATSLGLIWLGLAVFTFDGLRSGVGPRRPV